MRCWRREKVQESQGSRVPRSRGPKVPGSQGQRYLKLTFKYKLDYKEGPSCLILLSLTLLPIAIAILPFSNLLYCNFRMILTMRGSHSGIKCNYFQDPSLELN